MGESNGVAQVKASDFKKAKAKESMAIEWKPYRVEVWVDQIVPSKLQQRTQWGDMDALTEHIREHGVLTEPKCRPLDPSLWVPDEKLSSKFNAGEDFAARGNQLELIDGERRTRAAKAAGRTTIWVLLGLCDDTTALEIQAAGNLRQEHYHPLDEARLYARLLQEYHGDLDRLEKRVKQPRAYLERTMVLTQAAQEVREALIAGKIHVDVARSIARIPGELNEVRALNAVKDMTPQAARAYILREFTLRLADAPFDSRQLFQCTGMIRAVTCAECHFNTAVQRNLFDDAADEARCGDKICWDAKAEASWQQEAAAARAAGSNVVEHRLEGSPETSGFVALDAVAPGSVETWRQILVAATGELPAAEQHLIRDRNGHPTWLVPRAYVESRAGKLLKGKDAPKLPEDPKAAKEREKAEKQHEKARVALREQVIGALVSYEEGATTDVLESYRGAIEGKERMRVCARALVEDNHFTLGQPIAKRRELSLEGRTAKEALLAEIERQPQPWIAGLVMEFMLFKTVMSCSEKRVQELCELWGIDYDALKPAKKVVTIDAKARKRLETIDEEMARLGGARSGKARKGKDPEELTAELSAKSSDHAAREKELAGLWTAITELIQLDRLGQTDVVEVMIERGHKAEDADFLINEALDRGELCERDEDATLELTVEESGNHDAQSIMKAPGKLSEPAERIRKALENALEAWSSDTIKAQAKITSKSDWQKAIDELKAAGIVEQSGKKRGARYRLAVQQ